MENIENDRNRDSTTLIVDFQKLKAVNPDLAESIRAHFHKVLPSLEKAASDFVRKYIHDSVRLLMAF